MNVILLNRTFPDFLMAVSCVFTQFYVNHAEPLAVLEIFKTHRWCLGELPKGHELEILVILPVSQVIFVVVIFVFFLVSFHRE